MRQRHELLAEVDVLLAGRASEEVFLCEITDGAGNDLERATDIIKFMVSRVGMSDVVGLSVLEKQQSLFLNGGQSIKDYSEETAVKIDNYVRDTLDKHYKAVKETLSLYGGAIEEIVEALYEKETIEGEKVREIIEKFEQKNGLPSRLVNNPSNDEDIKNAKNADAKA